MKVFLIVKILIVFVIIMTIYNLVSIVDYKESKYKLSDPPINQWPKYNQ
jgi:hypothetical protein